MVTIYRRPAEWIFIVISIYFSNSSIWNELNLTSYFMFFEVCWLETSALLMEILFPLYIISQHSTF
jgi:hypothetical protein